VSNRREFDVLVVGGGPAGIAAAVRAAEAKLRVAIVDDNPALGGQIWRGEHAHSTTNLSRQWFDRLASVPIEHLRGLRVFAQADPYTLLAEASDQTHELGFAKLVLATGARERFLPFPGWTMPNVLGAGGLQALAKSGVPLQGKRVVVAGTGPLLLAVAAHLKEHGAKLELIAEQASTGALATFGLALLGHGSKIAQGVSLRRQLAGVPIHTSSWVVSAEGREVLESVTLRIGKQTRKIACDYLACGFHLVPNTELAALLGCRIHEGVVTVDDLQQTSIANIYCAGEPTGIGGVELSLIEGEIAGCALAGNASAAHKLFAQRAKYRKFARAMNRAVELNPALKQLAQPETLVCRCEDVSLARLREHSAWRSAKLHTRCGMGPCQGRICGPAVEFLLGWKVESVRPPVFPVRIASLQNMAAANRAPSEDEESSFIRS
jgi:NADPH-dependent 2,4-dienoyl-CoA reductase/sulfur reductase-like enzyme